MDMIAEKRFQTLKRNLDALHYSQPLSNSFHNSLDIESAALVERLLSDLVKTSEGFQTLKRQNEDLRNNLLKEKQLVRKLSTNLLAGTIKEGK